MNKHESRDFEFVIFFIILLSIAESTLLYHYVEKFPLIVAYITSVLILVGTVASNVAGWKLQRPLFLKILTTALSLITILIFLAVVSVIRVSGC